MNAILDFLTENWEMLSLLIYEIVVRVWPTKWNLSILDQTMKLIGTILKNRRVPQGDENVERKADGTLVNAVKVDLTKHIIKSLLVVMMVGVFACSSQAQQWENYKGIRLVNNRDTAQQIAVQGSLFFDDVLDSLYLYDGARWLNLSRAASNGGGGGLMTASNGLNVLGSDVRLGGSLTQPVNITGLTATNTFSIEQDGTAVLHVNNNFLTLGRSGYTQFRLSNSGSITHAEITGNTGLLKYSSDKFSNYDDRTVPDWGNVKSLLAIPSQRVPYGTGTGITHSPNFTFNSTTRTLTITPPNGAVDGAIGIGGVSGLNNIIQQTGPTGATTYSTTHFPGQSQYHQTMGGGVFNRTEVDASKIQFTRSGSSDPAYITSQTALIIGAVDSLVINPLYAPAPGSGKLLTMETSGRIGTLDAVSTYSPTFYNTSNITSILERKVIVTRLGNTVRVDFSIDADIGSNPIFDMDLPVPVDFTSADDVIGMAWLGGASSSCEVITNVADDRVTFAITNNPEILGTLTGYFIYQL